MLIRHFPSELVRFAAEPWETSIPVSPTVSTLFWRFWASSGWNSAKNGAKGGTEAVMSLFPLSSFGFVLLSSSGSSCRHAGNIQVYHVHGLFCCNTRSRRVVTSHWACPCLCDKTPACAGPVGSVPVRASLQFVVCSQEHVFRSSLALGACPGKRRQRLPTSPRIPHPCHSGRGTPFEWVAPQTNQAK